MEQVTSPVADTDHNPANARTTVSSAVMKYACLPVPVSRGCHSYQPSAGTRQRRWRNDGAEAFELINVSARAVIIPTPIPAAPAPARTSPPPAPPHPPPP